MSSRKECSTVENEKLIEDHLPLVYRLARQISRRLPLHYDFDDLVGYGMVGLVQAAKKFQPGRGVEFITFAYPRINGAIFDGVASLSWMNRAQFKRFLKQREERENGGNADTQPTESSAYGGRQSISYSPESTSGSTEEIASNDLTPIAIVTKRESIEILGLLVASLPPRKRMLVTAVYIDGLSLQQASERLGISKGWASRLHASILAELADLMNQQT